MPRTRPRDAGSGQTTRMIARDDGSSSAAPTPVRARPAISTPMPGANAQITDATVITAAPTHECEPSPVKVGNQSAAQQ